MIRHRAAGKAVRLLQISLDHIGLEAEFKMQYTHTHRMYVNVPSNIHPAMPVTVAYQVVLPGLYIRGGVRLCFSSATLERN